MASEETKIAILRAAEKLFAEKGIDSVSMREISLAAGQNNPSAAGYHFNTKLGVIDAVLERHHGFQREWVERIETATEPPTFRELVEMMVAPIVQKLDDPDGGVYFIRIATQLCNHPTWPLIDRPVSNSESAIYLINAIRETLTTELPEEIQRLRYMRIAAILYHSVCDYFRSGQQVPRPVFISDLVDVLESVITNVSDETYSAIEQMQANPSGE